jgi:hypothetical protein
MRWLHPTRGMIPPSDFIPLAEETGLIVSMGRWLLREACREAAELHASFPELPPVRMSVNLSVKQLQSETIVEDVRAALVESGLAAENLVLEITESVMMADAGLAVQRLTELKALGLRLAMDDFGTGYSSLSYLSRFPVDILKMDRSFLQAGERPRGRDRRARRDAPARRRRRGHRAARADAVAAAAGLRAGPGLALRQGDATRGAAPLPGRRGRPALGRSRGLTPAPAARPGSTSRGQKRSAHHVGRLRRVGPAPDRSNPRKALSASGG